MNRRQLAEMRISTSFLDLPHYDPFLANTPISVEFNDAGTAYTLTDANGVSWFNVTHGYLWGRLD